jgi:hypothetical protein
VGTVVTLRAQLDWFAREAAPVALGAARTG